MPARTDLLLTLASACAACFVPLRPAAQSVSPGDVVLYSAQNASLLRIDLASGTSSLLTDLTIPLTDGDCLAWDPFRRGLVFGGSIAGGPADTWLLDGATGSLRSLGSPGVNVCSLAPTGDGRIYHQTQLTPPGQIRYLDAADTRHVLLDASGTAPFALAGEYRELHYHAATNSLFAAGSNLTLTCTGGTSVGVLVTRIH